MGRIAPAAALGLLLLVAACGGHGKGTGVTAKRSPNQRICAAAKTPDLDAVLGKAPKGTPKDVPGGHGCVWVNGSDAALAVIVYDKGASLPSGDGAAKSLADELGLNKDSFSSSSITTSTGDKPVAMLVLSSGSQPADSTAERRIRDAAVGAAG